MCVYKCVCVKYVCVSVWCIRECVVCVLSMCVCVCLLCVCVTHDNPRTGRKGEELLEAADVEAGLLHVVVLQHHLEPHAVLCV